MKLRFPLFSKVMLWFFLNLLFLGAILFLIFNFRFESPTFFRSSSRIEAVTRQFESEISDKTRAEYDPILQKYSEQYGIEFLLFDYTGRQLGGAATALPKEVLEEVTKPERGRRGEKQTNPTNPNESGEERRGTSPDRSPPSVYITTRNPTLYWFVGRIFTFEDGSREPMRSRLVAASTSFTGGGLFFDPTPFIVLGSVVVVFSLLFWLPFVRNITRAVGQMTVVAGEIAEEKFDVRVADNRTDELGNLGASINHLASRLSGFVHGQKRFLGDISHELNSPLARMQFALSILEDCSDDEKRRLYVEDVKEEVVLMSKLVGELLDYSKAGIKASEVKLETVNLRALAVRLVKREQPQNSGEIEIKIDENLTALASPNLLARALDNVVRNAVRYAGDAGKITIKAEQNRENQIALTVADNGAGVAEAELEKLFDPFYRVETHRSRESGGTGLGLAIVKTCVEACGGKVFARNRKPHGLEVTIILQAK